MASCVQPHAIIVKDGKTKEYLFWDNQSFMKQIGLAQ